MDWLKNIADGFNQFLDFFKNIGDFITGLIKDILYIVQVTGETVAKIPEYFSWLPSAALTVLVSVFAVVVIYKILGREG